MFQVMNRRPFSDVEWYQLIHHPNPEFESVIRCFARQTAEQLNIKDPQIAWFKRADYVTAENAFNSCRHREGTSADMSDDPTKSPCEFFRLSYTDEQLTAGFTPDNSSTMLISTEAPDEEVLRAVADECYHLLQDAAYGQGWRAQNRLQSETEAAQFTRSQQNRILAALNSTSRGIIWTGTVQTKT